MHYDLVFTYINVINGFVSGCEYQLNVGYIRAYLEKQGINTIQYTNQKIGNYLEIVNDLDKLGSCFVFFINEYNYYINKSVINKLRKIKSNAKIFVIGPSAKFISKELAQDVSFDICIYANEAFSLQKILSMNTELENIKNIAFRKADKIFFTSEEKVSYSLDDIGMPYSSGMIPTKEIENVGMTSSTGCYGACTFCSYIESRGVFRYHKIETIISELNYIRTHYGDHNIRIPFYDDCFSVSKERIIELCEKIIENKFNFKFWCCTRADLLTEEVINAMFSAGFRDVIIGLETASPNILDKLDKVSKRDTAIDYLNHLKRMFNYAKDKGLNPMLSLNFGLPFEEYEDAKKTVKFVKDNFATKSVSICYMTCFPGSKVFGESKFYEVVKEASPTKLPYYTVYEKYNMKELTDLLIREGVLTDSMIEVLTSKSMYSREYNRFVTGNHSYEESTVAIKYIKIDNLDEEKLSFIDRNLDINGSLVFYEDKVKISSKNLFTDDRKRLKIQIKKFDDNLEFAYKNDAYISNQKFVIKYNNEFMYQPCNLYMPKMIKSKIAKLENPIELQEIEKKVKAFIESSRIELEDLNKYIIQNSCRYTASCGLHSLDRVYIKGKNVYGCNEKEVIGCVQDGYEDLIGNVAGLFDRRDKVRGCNNCQANKWCSKCVCISEGLSQEEYCMYIKRNPYMGTYLNILNLLMLNFNFENSKNEKIYVYSAKIYNDRNTNKFPYRLNDETIFIDVNGNYFVASEKSGNIVRSEMKEKEAIMLMIGLKNIDSNISHFMLKVARELKLRGF